MLERSREVVGGSVPVKYLVEVEKILCREITYIYDPKYGQMDSKEWHS
jgi:hypothetical protein